MATTYSAPFMDKPDSGFRLGDIRSLWDAIANNNGISRAYGIAAAGTTQATATQLTAVGNQIDTVTASSGVNLPDTRGARSTPFNYCLVINNGASTLTVYAAQGKTDTINGTAGATGVSVPVGVAALFQCVKPGAWFTADVGEAGSFTTLTVSGTSTLAAVSESDNLTFTAVGKGIIQKTGTNGRAGLVTLTGTTAVTVSNTSIVTSDVIVFSLATVGGAVGAAPTIKTITAATGFTVAGTAGDTSTYNYCAFGTSI